MELSFSLHWECVSDVELWGKAVNDLLVNLCGYQKIWDDGQKRENVIIDWIIQKTSLIVALLSRSWVFYEIENVSVYLLYARLCN